MNAEREHFRYKCLRRFYDYVNICLFVNIEIKTCGWHIQKTGVVLKTVCCQHCMASVVGRDATSRKFNVFHYAQGLNSINAFVFFLVLLYNIIGTYYPFIIFGQQF